MSITIVQTSYKKLYVQENYFLQVVSKKIFLQENLWYDLCIIKIYFYRKMEVMSTVKNNRKKNQIENYNVKCVIASGRAFDCISRCHQYNAC